MGKSERFARFFVLYITLGEMQGNTGNAGKYAKA